MAIGTYYVVERESPGCVSHMGGQSFSNQRDAIAAAREIRDALRAAGWIVRVWRRQAGRAKIVWYGVSK